MHAAAPCVSLRTLNVPGWQTSQSVEPGYEEKVPASQGTHEVYPEDGAYMPG